MLPAAITAGVGIIARVPLAERPPVRQIHDVDPSLPKTIIEPTTEPAKPSTWAKLSQVWTMRLAYAPRRTLLIL